jgi:uncharacterized protein (TIGR02145 family)
MKRYLAAVSFFLLGGVISATFAQGSPSKTYETCKYWELIEQIRAYEDTLAFEASLPDTTRGEYGKPVTDTGVSARVYRIYVCADLLDSLAARQDDLNFLRASSPVVDTDSTSAITATGATLHAKVTSDGGDAVSAQWFRYGLTAANLTDSIEVVGTATPFSVAVTGLDPATRYYFAAFAENGKGSASGDTLTFLTRCSVDSVLHQSYYYGVIQAETQCWLDENLLVTTYNNGDPIATGHGGSAWAALTTGGRAAPNGSSANVTTYGYLYNWYAVADSRGICPTGWHVPTEAAFDSLMDYLGGYAVAGTKLKALPPVWNGTDDIGFNGLPGGARDSFGSYQNFGSRLSMWTSTEATSANSARATAYQDGTANIINIDKNSGFSVRCLED